MPGRGTADALTLHSSLGLGMGMGMAWAGSLRLAGRDTKRRHARAPVFILHAIFIRIFD
jgi:hypothetical protein